MPFLAAAPASKRCAPVPVCLAIPLAWEAAKLRAITVSFKLRPSILAAAAAMPMDDITAPVSQPLSAARIHAVDKRAEASCPSTRPSITRLPDSLSCSPREKTPGKYAARPLAFRKADIFQLRSVHECPVRQGCVLHRCPNGGAHHPHFRSRLLFLHVIDHHQPLIHYGAGD